MPMLIRDLKNGATPQLILNDFDSINQVRITPNIVDNLCIETHTDSNGKVQAIFFNNDVSLLFNQQRLEEVLGRDGVTKFFDRLSQQSSALSELRSKISDSDLVELCKSRYIQSPSEILAWSEYLNNNYAELLSDIRDRTPSSAPMEESSTPKEESSLSVNE